MGIRISKKIIMSSKTSESRMHHVRRGDKTPQAVEKKGEPGRGTELDVAPLDPYLYLLHPGLLLSKQ